LRRPAMANIEHQSGDRIARGLLRPPPQTQPARDASPVDTVVKVVDVVLKGVATLATLAFFIYQLAAGSLVAATSLSLEVKPIKSGGKTWGIVTLKVERGDNWSVFITRAEVTVVEDRQPVVGDAKPVAGDAKPVVKDRKRETVSVDYKYYDRASFQLGPKEKTQYGAIVKLPDDRPALIEALVVTQQKGCMVIFCAESFVFGSIEVPPIAKSD
jgi:hypothetical protein